MRFLIGHAAEILECLCRFAHSVSFFAARLRLNSTIGLQFVLYLGVEVCKTFEMPFLCRMAPPLLP
jgi:hypothetical protein